MTLPFSTHINGKPNYFVEKIIKGLMYHSDKSQMDALIDSFMRTAKHLEWQENYIDIAQGPYSPKLHTIRPDSKDRWRTGRDIHFVINNRTPNRFQFAPVIPCVSVQKIGIRYKIHQSGDSVHALIDGDVYAGASWYPSGHIRTVWGGEDLARNDGFDCLEDFFDYFNEDFTGKIIHWTKLRY